MLGEIGPDVGSPRHPIPVIASHAWPGTGTISTGETLDLRLGGQAVSVIVREVRARFASLPTDTPFVVAPLQAMQALDPNRSLRATTPYIRAGERADDALRGAIGQRSDDTVIASRYMEERRLRDGPIITAILRGFWVAMLLGGSYAALVALATIALTASDCARDLSYLRTMGLSPAQAATIAVVEHVPLALLASVVGGVLGIGIAIVMEPGLGSDQLVTDLPIERLVIRWMTIVPVAGGVTLLVAIATSLATVFSRRSNLGSTLRLGE
jgi:predicted lysophospholipase L1 biosynthesis ABC-type transport system permease subunit